MELVSHNSGPAADSPDLNVLAGEINRILRSSTSSGNPAARGNGLMFIDARAAIKRLTQPFAKEFVNAYRQYAIACGNALVGGTLPTQPWAPHIFECAREYPGPFCFQIGPIEFANPVQACTPAIMSKIAHATTEIMSIHCHSPVQHDVYLGVSAPPSGPGKVSIFVWAPTFIRARAETVSIRTSIAEKLAVPMGMREPQLFSTEDGEPLKLSNGIPISDNHAFANLKVKLGRVAGTNGIIPLLWCADPAQIANPDRDASFPIMPYVGYGRLVVKDEEGELVKRTDYSMTLDDCLGPQGSWFLRESTEHIPRVEHADTCGLMHQSESSNELVNMIGCRAQGGGDCSTYDTLPLVISAGYANRDSVNIPTGELPENIFWSCGSMIKDKYNVQELLNLINRERFNTTTALGRSICSEILEALISQHMTEVSTLELAKALATREISNAAAAKGASGIFNPEALASHHRQNYDATRPKRSRRALSFYAQLDNPMAFSQLLASRIWSKLLEVGKADQQVTLAEALATYLMLDHYIVSSPDKNKTRLFFFKNPGYVEINDPPGYISSLLSPDIACGKLYTLLLKFRDRLNTLQTETRQQDSNNCLTTNFITERNTAIGQVIQQLHTLPYKNSLVREILTKIHQEQTMFLHIKDRQMDDDPYLTGVTNGTLEVIRDGRQRHIFWRPASPEDMITNSLNANYDQGLYKGRKWNLVEQYFVRLIKNERIRHWYLCQLAELFVGLNNKIATFLVGPPDCGKSMHFSFITGFLGESLGESIPSNILSDPGAGTDKAQPALARAAKGRAMFGEETSEIIRNGMFKLVAGGSARTALRGMYVSGSSQTIRAKAFIAMNQYPRFENYEAAIFVRLVVIEPDARYLDQGNVNLPSDPDEQEARRIFPKDMSYVASIRESNDAFLLYLMSMFDTWVNDKGERAELTAFPAAMEDARDRVRAQCVYADFVGRHIIKGGKDSVIHVKDVIARFRKHAANKGKGVSDSIIVSSISNVLGNYPLSDQSWPSWTFRDLEEAIGLPASEVPLLALNASVSEDGPIWIAEPSETGCDTSAYFGRLPDDYYSDCDDEDQEPEDIADPAEWVQSP